MPEKRLSELPIDAVLPEVVERAQAAGTLVLEAPPGAGKTTRVPPALLGAGVEGKIVVLEPRRLAARLAARRIAEERGERVGETVGYEVRFERVVSAATRIELVTEGILTRRLVTDPELRGVGAVILDEFHERHLQGDVALALLSQLRKTTRSDLVLVAMSATLDAAPVAAFLGAPIVRSAGRQYDVEVTYAREADERPLESQIASAIRELLQAGTTGDVLVFLPGAAEIRRAMERAAPLADAMGLLLVALHGDLSPDAQDLAIKKVDRQKVIFSTNVAETSVTIEGVEAVIDSGLARVAKYDPWSGRPSLEVTRISRASATQRAGRAGRLGPGRAVRLYTKGDFEARAEHDAPEILRADMAEVLLMLRSSRVTDVRQLAWLDAPPEVALRAAEQLLERLGAQSGDGVLTPLGRQMSMFGLPPRLSKLVIEAAARGALREGCTVAAMLAEGRDVYARSWDGAGDAPAGADELCDLSARLARIAEATEGGFDRQRAKRLGLVPESVMAVRKGADQILRACRAAGVTEAREGNAMTADEAIRRAVLAAYPDRVARRRPAPEGSTRLGVARELLLSSGGTAMLAETSVVKTAPWLVAVEAGDRRGGDPARRGGPAEKRQTRVWMASAIEPEWLIDLYPGAVSETVDVSWSAERERVEAMERLTYDRLVLDERPAGAAADHAAARLLTEKALAAGIGAFAGADAFDRLTRRLQLVAREAPDLAERAGIAALDETTLRTLLVARLAGKRSFAELREGSLLDEIKAAVGYAALGRLDELAPEEVTLGGGRRVQVHYEEGRPPWIESRLQDFFGGARTPTILNDRLPLVLHLLAPNYRAVQLTTDLAGFWARTYPTVRSELMRRYPRHAWPTDPLTASPPDPRGRGRRP
ncbi:MAG TPA: ATP-dependent helicase HrpB [Polyangiaceae bacterium]|nr:ATP-dependent helicase HrpB [Polyangiaceae bacterium]